MPDPTNVPATVDGSPLTPYIDADWWGATGTDEVEGYDLLKGEALLDLVGVPFMAFRAVWRDGIQRKDVPYRDDYASVECRIAPNGILIAQLPRINSRRAAQKPPVPSLGQDDTFRLAEEQVVANDGSTGLYRQIVQYVAAKGLIKLPEGPEEGEKGECIYDLPRSQWLEGAEAATTGFDIALRCSRGLRYSEYPSDYLPVGEMARTWYIA